MKYKQKPIEVEAVQFTGRDPAEIQSFTDECLYDSWEPGVIFISSENNFAHTGDWIVKIHGTVEIASDDDFRARYEPI